MKTTVKNGKVYNEQGEVAVLYSPGYGAGWSTWNDHDCLFTPEIVQLVIDKVPTEEIAIKCIKLFGDDFYYGGVMDGLAIAWLKPGTRFRINENDGSESVDIETDGYWEIA
ncbi:TPA: hypothetical protein QB617_000231 [Pasteurella multocida]|nr:hypothetical protein [Pasteurella multocida]